MTWNQVPNRGSQRLDNITAQLFFFSVVLDDKLFPILFGKVLSSSPSNIIHDPQYDLFRRAVAVGTMR